MLSTGSLDLSSSFPWQQVKIARLSWAWWCTPRAKEVSVNWKPAWAKSQTMGHMAEAPIFNISKQTRLLGLPVTEYGWHTRPSTCSFPAQGLCCPSPRSFSLYSPAICVTCPFFYLLLSWLLHLVFQFLSILPPEPPRPPLRVMLVLDSEVSAGYALPFSTINCLLHHA